MPAFGPSSAAKLATCHEDLQVIFNEVIKDYDCTIICGHRGQAEQEQAFQNGKSMVQWPNSRHNSQPSMAVDAGPYFSEIKNLDWQDLVAFGRFAGYVERVARVMLAEGKITHRIRWGGDWDGDGRTADERFKDLPHFELIQVD